MDKNITEQSKLLLDQSLIHFGSFSINAYGIAIVVIFMLLAYSFWRMHKDDTNDYKLSDMITSMDPFTGREKVSATRVLQLLGGITATFIVVKLTLQAALTWDIFVTYLAYVASIEGFSKFIIAKYSAIAGPGPVHTDTTETRPAGSAKPKDVG